MTRKLSFDWSCLGTAEFNLVTQIVGVAMRQPDLIIAPHGTPYVFRWHVIPRNAKANVYLHVQVADDAGRDMHDHPYDSQSVILAGGYIEEMPYGGGTQQIMRVPGDVIHRRASDLHRLSLLRATPSVSLFTTGPRVREWGFMTPTGWVAWTPKIALTNGNTSVLKEAAE